MRERQNNKVVDEYILQQEPTQDIEIIESTNKEAIFVAGKSSFFDWIILIVIVFLLVLFA